jgi:hypothetical protein
LSLGNRAGAFRVCTFVLDCFGHEISPMSDLFTVLRCKGHKQGETKRSLYLKLLPAPEDFTEVAPRILPPTS